jgi:predicted AAA+ superfamily ATPase
MIEDTAKEAIISKALNRGRQTLAQVAEANNVALGTLGGWLNKHRALVKNTGKTVGAGERYNHWLCFLAYKMNRSSGWVRSCGILTGMTNDLILRHHHA